MEEKPSAARPIRPLSTDTAAFIGLAESGPTCPELVTSFSEFRSIFGAPVPDSHLGLIVQIGVAPTKPAEFVIIRIQQLAGQTRPQGEASA